MADRLSSMSLLLILSWLRRYSTKRRPVLTEPANLCSSPEEVRRLFSSDKETSLINLRKMSHTDVGPRLETASPRSRLNWGLDWITPSSSYVEASKSVSRICIEMRACRVQKKPNDGTCRYAGFMLMHNKKISAFVSSVYVTTAEREALTISIVLQR